MDIKIMELKIDFALVNLLLIWRTVTPHHHPKV